MVLKFVPTVPKRDIIGTTGTPLKYMVTFYLNETIPVMEGQESYNF